MSKSLKLFFQNSRFLALFDAENEDETYGANLNGLTEIRKIRESLFYYLKQEIDFQLNFEDAKLELFRTFEDSFEMFCIIDSTEEGYIDYKK